MASRSCAIVTVLTSNENALIMNGAFAESEIILGECECESASRHSQEN
jgi:hypothetical protein